MGLLDVERYVSAWSGTDVDVIFDVAKVRIKTADLAGRADDDGIVRLGEGEDGDIDMLDRTSFRPIGRVMRMGVGADRSTVAVSRLTPPVSDWLSGSGGTWADDPPLAAVAEVIDEDDEVYAASLYLTAGASADDGSGEGPRPVASWTAVSGIPEAQRTTIVYLFESAADGELSLPEIEAFYVLGEPGTGWTMEVEEVVQDGRLVVVRGRRAPVATGDG